MIEISALSKVFRLKREAVVALEDVNLTVAEREFFVLLGPSGSGKTTLLRCVAGLEDPDEGEIALGGRVVFSASKGIFVPAKERGNGMVFQSYAVWPHLTVFENVALPLTDGRVSVARAAVREKVVQALHIAKIETLENRPVPLLSGGQQQRVALARALVGNPKVLLMDEPLSNLDARLREMLRFEIKEIVEQLGVSVLYVTHDQAEAMILADKIGIMGNGRIIAVGAPEELYDRPSNPTVAEFLGAINWLEAEFREGKAVDTEVGKLEVVLPARPASSLLVGIRPEDITISLSPNGRVNEFEGKKLSHAFVGDHSLYRIGVGPKDFLVKANSGQKLPGKLYVTIPPEKIKCFAREQRLASYSSA